MSFCHKVSRLRLCAIIHKKNVFTILTLDIKFNIESFIVRQLLEKRSNNHLNDVLYLFFIIGIHADPEVLQNYGECLKRSCWFHFQQNTFSFVLLCPHIYRFKNAMRLLAFVNQETLFFFSCKREKFHQLNKKFENLKTHQ